jgi:hypothetical protein
MTLVLSPSMLDHYRRMTPRERIAEMRSLSDVAFRALMVLPPEERARRLAAEDQIRQASIDALLEGLAAAETRGQRHGG